MAVTERMVRVGGIEVPAGTRGVGALPYLEFPDASVAEIPFVVLAGVRPGPRLYVGAAIHGDEVNGVPVVHRVVREVDPAQLAGEVVCVPIQNPLAVQAQHRLPIQLLLKSPMDQFPGDPWMRFPGDRAGNAADALAGVLFEELIGTSDAVVDVHTPTTGGRYVPFAFLPPPATGEARDRAMELATAFAPDFILAAEGGVYVVPGGLHVVAAQHGIPAFGVEFGEGGRVEESLTTRGCRGILDVLRHLNMLEGSPKRPASPRVLRSMTPIRSRRGGFLETTVRLGDEVEGGQVVARITDRYGEIVEVVRAPHAGPFMRMTTFPAVASGERVGQVGVLRDAEVTSELTV